MPSIMEKLKTPLGEPGQAFLRREEGSDGRDVCPACGEECDSVKVRYITRYVCVIAGASWQEMRLAGCPKCLRKELKRHLYWSILSANILWPFLVLPSVLWKLRKLDDPGHDPAWLALVDSIEEIEEDIARNAAVDNDELPPLPGDSGGETLHPAAEFYRPTGGRYGSRMLLISLAWVCLLPVACYFYALGCYHSPFLILGPLMLCAFAGLHGALLNFFARISGCRSEKGYRITVFLFGIWAVYWSWVCWLYIVNDYWYMVMDPLRIVRATAYISGEGFWSMGDRLIGQTEQLLYWGAEAFIMMIVPLGIAWNSIRKRPFCNSCGETFRILFKLRQLEPPAQPAAFQKALKAGRFEMLEQWPMREGANYIDVEILRCENCRNDYLLRTSMYLQQANTKKKEGGMKLTFTSPQYCSSETVRRLQKRRRP